MFKILIRLIPLTTGLIVLSCSTQPALAQNQSHLYIGTGTGQSSTTGDVNRTFSGKALTMGLEFDRDKWVALVDTAAAEDNRLNRVKLVGAYGNKYIKVGTGFIGGNSSIPTTPGTVARFYATASNEDTKVSASTIPLFLRFTPIKTKNFMFNVDGFYGLYSIGSMTIPVQTIIPNRNAYLTTQSKKSGGVYGGSISMLYRFKKDMGLRLSYTTQYGKMDAGSSRIENDPLGITTPVATPNLNFKNDLLLISFSMMLD